ncbi:hypothetical protein B0J11DRAFT_536242 [Dendryphion nanum]|uniref:Uncharacterized protein n=1 Tax=Dendryphion nanum TaxID=256645 RepID=A0A9P9IF25_9PLEO|nr:hypothetical protein B0J11DRAFT_536242 [Dendryphion nanum]
MPSTTAYTIAIFGLSCFLSGIFTLFNASISLSTLDLPPTARPAVQASSLAAIAMGVFYCLAAWQENRAFFKFSLGTRTLTTVVFLRTGGPWWMLGIWEGVGVLSTMAGLVWDRRKRNARWRSSEKK